jgi:hypothetical protein
MIFDTNTDEQRARTAKYLTSNINAPYVHAEVSTLGGYDKASAMLRISLDDRKEWSNDIFHNSRYLFIRLERNGELDPFAQSYKLGKKMRKSHVKSLEDAVEKINKFIDQKEG